MKLDLLLTPFPLDRINLRDKTVVVIDILRSSTTICASLQAGARGIIPTAGPGEAGELRAKLGPENTVLAGERNGVKIESFQFGNSPTEFTPKTVGDKTVILCTTNGTGIFGRSARAARVLAGGFVNISRLSAALAGNETETLVVCAGREGGFSIEDTLCGGLLIDRLNTVHGCDVTLNDAGRLARLLYRDTGPDLRRAIAAGEHGSFLTSIGLGADVDICTEIDSIPTLPVLRDGRLVADGGDAET